MSEAPNISPIATERLSQPTSRTPGTSRAAIDGVYPLFTMFDIMGGFPAGPLEERARSRCRPGRPKSHRRRRG